ncbi:MAG: sulfurtransferase [Magnetococcales bacterium]|nr:sulfurtransferase [Magnetococcales bacterium]NGZ06978.1 sulfurtransferase [Magnetococcales bacterium]
MDDAGRWPIFVDGNWLQGRLGDPGVRVVQVGGEKDYPRLHLPGAVLVSYGEFTTQRDGLLNMRAEDAVLAALFGRLGIGVDTPVVVYDLSGGTDAGRFAWSLATMGHRGGCALLDGGLPWWYQERRPLDTVIPVVPTVPFQALPDRSWEADREWVEAVTEGEKEGLLLDTRSRNEYMGLTLRAPHGHLAGAIHWDWMESLNGRQDPRLQPLSRLADRLAALGLDDPGREVILYCETAHRAAHTWNVLRHLGWERVRLYDGSMAEWRVYDLPVVAGENPR